MTDLSHILPDAEPVSPSTDFPGCALPVDSALVYRAETPAACAGCPKLRTEHMIWSRIRLMLTAAAQNYFIVQGNKRREFWRRVQALTHLMNLTTNGLNESNQIGVAGYPPASTYGPWEVTGIAGQDVTCIYQEGDDNPADAAYGYLTENPDYIPGVNEHYLTNPTEKAMPAGGLMFLSEESQLTEHGGYIVGRLICEKDIAVGESFTFRLITPIGGIAMEKAIDPATGLPYATSIKAGYGVYMYAAAPIAVVRDCLPLWWLYDEAYDPITVGQDRCANSVMDQTGTWGDPSTEADPFTGAAITRHYYCGYWSAADPAGAEFLAAYTPACRQTTCPGWTVDTPTMPYQYQLLRQILYGHPWLLTQFMEGLNAWEIRRIDQPGLASLCGFPITLPGGWHPFRYWNFESGGWPQIKTVNGLAVPFYGFETLALSDAEASPRLDDPATWPDYGPAGNNFTRKREDTDAAEDDTSDPHRVSRSQCVANSCSWHRYTKGRADKLGQFQRMVSWTNWWPKIPDGTDEYETEDGTFQRGSWDAYFQPGTPKVYDAKLTFKGGRRYDRTSAYCLPRYGNGDEQVTTVTVASCSYADGKATLTLKNKDEYASSILPAQQEERETKWTQGATNVEVPEWARINNWRSFSARDGAGADSMAKKGHSVLFGAGFEGTRLYGKRLMVDWVKACAGAAGSWIPEVQTTVSRKSGPGYFWFPYDATTEEFDSITITRDSGAIILTPVFSVYNKAYGLAKDHYYYQEGTNTSGVKGVWVYFSGLNGTGVPADREMHVVLVTTGTGGKTYTTDENVETDATYGWDNVSDVTFSVNPAVTIDSIASVIVTKGILDPETADPTTQTLDPVTPAPATWAAWDVNSYYVVSQSDHDVVLRFPPEWAGDMVAVTFTLVAFAGSESEFYNTYISWHSGLPTGHDTHNLQDQARIVDEGSIMADTLAEEGAAFLDDKVLVVTNETFAEPNVCDLFLSGPLVVDAEYPDANYIFLGASGEIWLKVPVSETGDPPCLYANLHIADRGVMPLADEPDAIRTALENMIGGSP